MVEISRETCKRCRLLFTNMQLRCICCSDGISTSNSVVNIPVMGLELGQSSIGISTMDILLYAKVSLLYNVLWDCIVVVYT